VDVNAQQLYLRRHNSWTMVAEEIETPELAEVMAINAMAPFILCARLKGLLGRGGAGGSSSCAGPGPGASAGAERGAAAAAGASAHGARPPPPGVPAAHCRFIINVSSMEGKFYFYKLPTHPHTTMAKAALNMLTRTAAGEYALGHGIYMCAVDTGWINEELPRARAADKAARSGFATPLDELDAAARILDPVLEPLAQAQAGGGECSPLYGAFLKDYRAGEW
jgi:NAD(P)-dependent dehydrogenase (short-subunit alcohol dehydrogenase family)